MVQQWTTTYTPELIAAVSNGLTSTSISYAPLTNTAVYSKYTNASYPVQDINSPIYVVSRVDAPNGLGGTYAATYTYGGGKLDLTGRGFLGFRWMIATDLQTGIKQETDYRLDYPFIGLVDSVTKWLPSVTTLSYSANTYACPCSTPAQVFLTQTVNYSFDLDGTAVPYVTTTYQYDMLSNATQVVVSTSDGFSKTTTNTYTNDTTNWVLGRLTSSIVTSVAP
jgi:hypothetical protein